MDRVRVWVMDRVVMDRVRVWHTTPKIKLQNLQGTKRLGLAVRPAQIWPYACVPDPNRSEPSHEAMKDARRSVTGPLSAASARYLRMGDSF
jgi:hypothetical protein